MHRVNTTKECGVFHKGGTFLTVINVLSFYSLCLQTSLSFSLSQSSEAYPKMCVFLVFCLYIKDGRDFTDLFGF